METTFIDCQGFHMTLDHDSEGGDGDGGEPRVDIHSFPLLSQSELNEASLPLLRDCRENEPVTQVPVFGVAGGHSDGGEPRVDVVQAARTAQARKKAPRHGDGWPGMPTPKPLSPSLYLSHTHGQERTPLAPTPYKNTRQHPPYTLTTPSLRV